VDNEKIRFYYNLVNDDRKMVIIMAVALLVLAIY